MYFLWLQWNIHSTSQEKTVFSTQIWRLKGINSAQVKDLVVETHTRQTNPMASGSQSQLGKGQACSSVTTADVCISAPVPMPFQSYLLWLLPDQDAKVLTSCWGEDDLSGCLEAAGWERGCCLCFKPIEVCSRQQEITQQWCLWYLETNPGQDYRYGLT